MKHQKRRSCIDAEREYGDERAPVMVLLHGYGMDSSCWLENLASLARRYHVYALDMRYTCAPQDMVADLIAWINSKEWLCPMILIGHSLGAKLCLQLTVQISHLVERLILVNPAVDLPETACWIWIWRCYQARTVSGHPEKMQAIIRRATISSWKWALRGLRAPLSSTLIETPTLILWGERDPLFPPRYSARLVSCLAQSTMLLIAAGHCIMRDQPALFDQAISAFLSQDRAEQVQGKDGATGG